MSQPAHNHAPSGGHAHGISHVMSPRMLLGVFAALIALTLLTVALGQLELGAWEVAITMLIATVKAGLVATFFMHLRYDSGFNALIFLFSLLFVALFIGFTLIDVERYQADLIPASAPAQPEASR